MQNCFLPKDISPAEQAFKYRDRSSPETQLELQGTPCMFNLGRCAGAGKLTSGPWASEREEGEGKH
jgi:hypothetical protein